MVHWIATSNNQRVMEIGFVGDKEVSLDLSEYNEWDKGSKCFFPVATSSFSG